MNGLHAVDSDAMSSPARCCCNPSGTNIPNTRRRSVRSNSDHITEQQVMSYALSRAARVGELVVSISLAAAITVLLIFVLLFEVRL